MELFLVTVIRLWCVVRGLSTCLSLFTLGLFLYQILGIVLIFDDDKRRLHRHLIISMKFWLMIRLLVLLGDNCTLVFLPYCCTDLSV